MPCRDCSLNMSQGIETVCDFIRAWHHVCVAAQALLCSSWGENSNLHLQYCHVKDKNLDANPVQIASPLANKKVIKLGWSWEGTFSSPDLILICFMWAALMKYVVSVPNCTALQKPLFFWGSPVLWHSLTLQEYSWGPCCPVQSFFCISHQLLPGAVQRGLRGWRMKGCGEDIGVRSSKWVRRQELGHFPWVSWGSVHVQPCCSYRPACSLDILQT